MSAGDLINHHVPEYLIRERRTQMRTNRTRWVADRVRRYFGSNRAIVAIPGNLDFDENFQLVRCDFVRLLFFLWSQQHFAICTE